MILESVSHSSAVLSISMLWNRWFKKVGKLGKWFRRNLELVCIGIPKSMVAIEFRIVQSARTKKIRVYPTLKDTKATYRFAANRN